MNKITLNLEKALSYLVEGKIIPSDVLPKSDFIFGDKILIECISLGSPFEYDSINDELLIVTKDGDKIKAPDLSEGTSTSSSWIVDYLPEVLMDIDQGGNVRRGDEAESCYKILCIGYVIPQFKEEIISFFEKYDYEKMASKERDSYDSFNQFLQSFQNLNSVRLNSIISAASLKISMYKEKNESYYTGWLDLEEIIKLSTLSRELKAKISEYEKVKGLNSNDIKNLSKISKLSIIDERDRALEEIISKSDVGMLHRITKLTSERIPPVIKALVYRKAEEASIKHVKDNNLKDFDAIDAQNYVRRTVILESNRAILKTIKADEILKYKKDPGGYKFKIKA